MLDAAWLLLPLSFVHTSIVINCRDATCLSDIFVDQTENMCKRIDQLLVDLLTSRKHWLILAGLAVLAELVLGVFVILKVPCEPSAVLTQDAGS